MFTTNAVQTGTVPTLQYQDHANQKSQQAKITDHVHDKNSAPNQQTQQQPQVHYLSVKLSNDSAIYYSKLVA